MNEALSTNNGLMKVKDLAKYLNYDIQTIYRMVKAKEIPFVKVPGKSTIRFSKEEIDKWLQTDKEPETSQEKS